MNATATKTAISNKDSSTATSSVGESISTSSQLNSVLNESNGGNTAICNKDSTTTSSVGEFIDPVVEGSTDEQLDYEESYRERDHDVTASLAATSSVGESIAPVSQCNNVINESKGRNTEPTFRSTNSI